MLIVLFAIWLVICSWLAGRILAKFFAVSSGFNYILGSLFSLILLGFIANIFTAWFKLTDSAIIFSFILTAGLLAAWLFCCRKNIDETADWLTEENYTKRFPIIIWLAFLLAIVGGFFAIFVSVDAGGLASPWQVLPLWYLLPIFICAAIIFSAIFYGEKAWRVLVGVIIFSFLIHSYLLVYNNGFGGDRFRHLASETRIISGMDYQPNLLAGNLWLKQIGPLRVPAAFIDSAKLSYGFEWSLEVIASKISGLGVFQVNRFLLPILWSLFLPLLIYLISLSIWPDRRLALLAAGLSNIFYLLQYYGGQGLPASYGFLVFSATVALWLAWTRKKDARLLLFCLFISLLSYFNYSLTFILVIIFGSLAESLRFSRRAVILVAGLLSALILFLLDAGWPIKLSVAFNCFYGAWRNGNMIFFQSGARLSQFTGKAYLIPDLLALFALAVLIGWLIIKYKHAANRQAGLLAIFFGVLISAYFASWIFLDNGHLLARRLTLFLILPLVLFFAFALNIAIRKKIIPAAILVAVLAALTAYSYFSGPVLAVSITSGDIARASELWPQIKNSPDICVKEPLSVILALEYVSAKEFQETVNDINCGK